MNVPFPGARLGRLLLGVAALTVAVAGCGTAPAGDELRGHTLHVYVSLPLQGTSAAVSRQVLSGARQALAQVGGSVGRFHVQLHVLDDSSPQREAWDPGQTLLAARTAASDPRTVAYLGELDSGASAVSIPVLNRAGIVQVSPASTAVGLTQGGAGADPGEPQKYYPTGIRTFARLVSDDAVQARVQATVQRQAGCRTTYVLGDGSTESESTDDSFSAVAPAAGLPVAGVAVFDPHAPDYTSVAAGAAATGADCVMISGVAGTGPVLLTRQLAAALPQARLFATAGLVHGAYLDPAQGGLPASYDRRLIVTSPVTMPAGPPSGARRGVGAGAAAPSTVPAPEAAVGYESMSLLLDTVARASHNGTKPVRRSRVREALFKTRNRQSVLGLYSLTTSGDISPSRYGIFRVASGRLVPWRTVGG